MKGKIVLSLLLFLGAALATADVAPQISGITVDASWDDGTVFKNETVHIRWTHSAFYTSPSQTCRIFCAGHVISPPLPVISKDFTWTGGRKFDGTYIPQGKPYRITIENNDFDALSGPDIALVDEQPKFTINAPANNASLLIGATTTIRWSHSTYYDVFTFCEYIASVPVVNDQFVWQVGKAKNGSVAPAGNFRLTGEQNEYWQCNDVNIRLIGLIRPPFRLYAKKLLLDKIPDCPMCFKFDLGQIKFDGEGQLPVDVELLRNGVLLAKLGRFGERRAAPGPVKIVLEQE
nr:hypothetical protein [Acidobacteriota bacterium]